MSRSIKEYRNLIEQPWGRMFYDIIFSQLNISDTKPLNILDFGAGFCVTANHYAKNHNVTAIEPNAEMVDLRIKDNGYTLISKGIEALKEIDDNSFDVVICHNVLEYVEDKSKILSELSRVLKNGGILSIVKHNLCGRILSEAVMKDNPEKALSLLTKEYDGAENMFGKRDTYANDYLIKELSKHSASLDKMLAIRTFFALSTNNDIKHTDSWYQSMLELEMKASAIDEFIKTAFFNHLIFIKA